MKNTLNKDLDKMFMETIALQTKHGFSDSEKKIMNKIQNLIVELQAERAISEVIDNGSY